MDYKNLMQAYSMAQEIHAYLANIDDERLYNNPNPSTTLQEYFALDIGALIMHLSASDGEISDTEYEIFKAVTGYESITKDEMIEQMMSNGFFTNEYHSKPPFIMEVVSVIEHNLVDLGAEIETSGIYALKEFFKFLGEFVIAQDGGYTINERTDFLSFVKVIEKFAKENDLSMS